MASLRRAPAAALQRPAASGGADDTEACTASFEQQFAALAADPAEFDAFMQEAYYWQDELARGKTFETMNPEAQAELINDIALALADDVIDTTMRRF